MQLVFSKPLLLKYLFLCLGAVTLTVFVANYLFEKDDVAITVGNYLYVPIQMALLAVTVWAVRYFGIDSIHGIGWLSFLGFVVCWFAGDMTWIIQEMVLEIEPYPSVADLFYLPGYPFLLIFAVSYIIPFRDAISKKMIIISVCAAIILVSSSIYMIGIQDATSFDTALSMSYPAADGIILVPVLLGLFLFFKSRTDLMWSLMLFGMLATFAGDIAFAYMEHFGTYHTGNPMELAFYFSYILMTFGVIYHKNKMSRLGKNSA